MTKSGIHYADYAWNPATGCLPGLPCWERCWARAMATRFKRSFRPTFHALSLGQPERTKRPGVVAVYGNVYARIRRRGTFLKT